MLITVVLSVYNTGKYLPKAMASLLAQTMKDFEIIIVDDGSTDNSMEICEQEAKDKPFIRVFHKENGGLSSARNFGIEHAEGKLIIFPDPDDWVEPDYLEKLVNIGRVSKADLAICGHFDEMDGKRRIWNQGAASSVMDNRSAMETLMMPNSFCGYAWNKLYSMDVINAHNLRFDTQLGMAQDLHFAVRYFQKIKTVAYNPVPLYHYNHDSGGVTASYSPLSARKLSCLLTYKKIGDITKEDYPNVAEIAYSSLCNMCLQYIYIFYRSGMNDKDVLEMLRNNFMEFRSFFRRSKAYTKEEKMFMSIVPVSTRLYAFLTRMKKIVLNRVSRKNKAWKQVEIET